MEVVRVLYKGAFLMEVVSVLYRSVLLMEVVTLCLTTDALALEGDEGRDNLR